MSRYSIGDIVRIKDTKTAADGRMAVVVNTDGGECMARILSHLRVHVKPDQLEPLFEEEIREAGHAAAELAKQESESTDKKELLRSVQEAEYKTRRRILGKLLATFAVWFLCNVAAVILWAGTLFGHTGLAGYGMAVTICGYAVTLPQMLGLLIACVEDVEQHRIDKKKEKGG